MKFNKTYFIQAVLFILTILGTTMVGANYILNRSFFYADGGVNWADFSVGLYYSVPFLGFLTVHELGHYITARLYKIRVSLPYYIPLFFGIGTMGAFIRIKEPIKTRMQFFDIGIAGPLAGFVVAVGVLWYGFANLPPQEHIYELHPEYEQYGVDYADYVYDNDTTMSGFALGENLIFKFFKTYVVEDQSRIPHAREMMHYPWLFAGFLATLFTALNLIPIGQLDGGHVLYGLIGYKKNRIASAVFFILFVGYAGIGIITPDSDLEFLQWAIPLHLFLHYIGFGKMFKSRTNRFTLSLGILAFQVLITFVFPGATGYYGWLFFAFIIGRVLGVYHPPALIDLPVDNKRKILGWIALVIFIISFSPEPLIL